MKRTLTRKCSLRSHLLEIYFYKIYTARKHSLRSHLLEIYFYKKYTVKKIWTASAFIILIVLSVFSSGCFDSEATQSKEESLKIGLIPSEDQIEMLKKFEPVESYLETELGMNIETFTATDYTSVIEAMRANKIDVAFFGPFSYILASEQADAEAIVTGGTATGEVATYHSCIITHPDSGISCIEDLKNNANEITFSFVDPASTSGNLIPRGYLLSIGVDPDTDFKSCMFAGGHDASGLAVKSKNVDAGAIYDIGYNRLIESGAATMDDLIVMKHLRSISVDNGISTLAVLHQPDLARKYATRILGVKDGIIIYDGDADISDDDLAIIYGTNNNEK